MTEKYLECFKCKKNLLEKEFDQRTTGKLYTNCKSCRPANNIQSKQSYYRKDKTICNICMKEYSTSSNLNIHMWKVHEIGKGDILSCSDEKCEFKCKTKFELTKHMCDNHNKERNEFRCDECQNKYSSKGHLTRHMWVTHNKGNGSYYNCEDCQFTCKNKYDLYKHIETDHKKEWKCKNCDSGFITKKQLKKHSKENHPRVKDNNICSNCPYIYKTKKELQKHVWLEHKMGSDKNYKCEFCSFISIYKSELTQHLNYYHNKGDIECEGCKNKVYKIHTKKKLCRECYSGNIKKEKYINKCIEKQYTVQKENNWLKLKLQDFLVLVECTEFQHRGYTKEIEEERLNIEKSKYPNEKIVFILWNPDKFNINKQKIIIKRNDRVKIVMQLLDKIEKGHTDADIYYLFYSDDNKIVINNMSVKRITSINEL